VRELVGDIDGKFGFVGLAAVRAEEATEVPFGVAEGAEEAAFGAVAFGPEYAEKREGAAERAAIGSGSGG
jgi:hypothetical protein